MTGPLTDPGHLLPPQEWARVQAEAEQHAAAPGPVHAGLLTLGRSSFPSVTGFVQCRYDGGAQPAGGPKFGVLHDAETPLGDGYAASIASYFTRNTNSTSAHFMVGPDASLQLLDTGRIAWHVGNANTRSIGVEQAGYASLTTAQWTTAAGMQQMTRIAALIRDIRAAHGIGAYWMTDQQLRDAWAGRIVGGWATHHQCSRVIGGSTHTDPDPNYPYAQLMATANQEDDMDANQAQQLTEIHDMLRGGMTAPKNNFHWIDEQLMPVLLDIQAQLHGGMPKGRNNFNWVVDQILAALPPKSSAAVSQGDTGPSAGNAGGSLDGS